MKVNAVIDRFEGDKAVLLLGEQEIQVVWPRSILPSGSKEGDIIKFNPEIDIEATRKATEEAQQLLNEILKKNQEA